MGNGKLKIKRQFFYLYILYIYKRYNSEHESMSIYTLKGINNNEISNILILGSLIQSIMITPIAYRLTNNKYGYEVYG